MGKSSNSIKSYRYPAFQKATHIHSIVQKYKKILHTFDSIYSIILNFMFF